MVDEKLNEKPVENPDKDKITPPQISDNLENKVLTPAPEKKTIVIVDDNADVLRLASKFLQSGYIIKPFTNPVEALSFCTSSSHDLLLIDLLMPEMTGVEFINKLRKTLSEQSKEMPGVIMMTGSEDPDRLEGLVEKEQIRLMKKPFRSAELIRQVDLEIKGHSLPVNVLTLLDDMNFLQCAGLDTVGVAISSNPYELLAHACNHLKTDFVNYLETYGKTGNGSYLARAREAFSYFKTIIEGLDPEKLRGFDVFKWEPKAGGSALSEKGVRIFIKRSDTGYHFIRNIYSRKGVPHSAIDAIRQITSEEFSKKYHNGKFNVPHRFHSPLTEKDCTWSVEEAVMGPDLGYVFEKIKSRITELVDNDGDDSELSLLMNLRDELALKYLEDIKHWQEQAPQIKEPSVSRDPIELSNYLKSNISQIVEMQNKFGLSFSDLEKSLWKISTELFNVRNLDLNQDTIVRNLDASPMNAILKIITEPDTNVDKLRPSLNDITSCLLTEGGEISKKELNNRLYHVDHGFVYTHYLEDFFHLVDSSEVRDDRMSSDECVDKSLLRFRGFVVRPRNKRFGYNKNAFYLMGFYRNMRKVFLTVTEYHERNVRFRSSHQISGYKFAKDRKKYDEAIKHHVGMAETYLQRAITRYIDVLKRIEKDQSVPQVHRLITNDIINFVQDQSLTLEQAEQGITELRQRLETETSNKKYLNNAMYLCMSYALLKLTSKFENIKLPQINGTPKPDIL